MGLLQVISIVFVVYLFGNTGALPVQEELRKVFHRQRRNARVLIASSTTSRRCNQTLIGSGYAFHTSTSDVSLWYKNGWFMAVHHDGNINGTSEARSPDIKLQLQSVGRSLVRIFSKQTCLYVAMASTGKVYTTEEPTDETVFQQTQESNGFETFASNKHFTPISRDLRRHFFLSMRKNGHIKNGKRSTRNHKTTQLSVMQSRETS
ncbi:Fgf7p [Desmophyllum pertusum]|uniref:Fibroblast growth factor n=1 Tax=Desmophyllum pertusum TaxID=174260 RepID=A0A9W9YZ93_9CNID|nr:Fgf7p [Desmophyllum pertusum]